MEASNSINLISLSDPPAPPAVPATNPTSSSPTAPKNTRAQYLASFACAGAGGFVHGTVLGWASPASTKWYFDIPEGNGSFHHPLVSIKSLLAPNPFQLDAVQFSWVVTIYALGAALTAIPSGLMVQHLGRKTTMFLFLVPLIIGWLLVMVAANFLTILLGRLFLGITCGTVSVIVPLYTAEVSDPEIRGRTGALYQTMTNFGVLFMFALGPFVNLPTLVFISALVTLLFYVLFYFAPESPAFLVSLPSTSESRYTY